MDSRRWRWLSVTLINSFSKKAWGGNRDKSGSGQSPLTAVDEGYFCFWLSIWRGTCTPAYGQSLSTVTVLTLFFWTILSRMWLTFNKHTHAYSLKHRGKDSHCWQWLSICRGTCTPSYGQSELMFAAISIKHVLNYLNHMDSQNWCLQQLACSMCWFVWSAAALRADMLHWIIIGELFQGVSMLICLQHIAMIARNEHIPDSVRAYFWWTVSDIVHVKLLCVCIWV